MLAAERIAGACNPCIRSEHALGSNRVIERVACGLLTVSRLNTRALPHGPARGQALARAGALAADVGAEGAGELAR